VGLAGQGMERYGPFEPVGETHWDIAAVAGGENSRRLALSLDQDLEVRMECAGYLVSSEVTEPEEGFGQVGAEAFYFDLGSVAQGHPPEEWDGQPITVASEGGTERRFFRATYRLCGTSCAETALAPPYLWSHQMFGGQRWLEWTWTGDPSSIDGLRARYDCYDRNTGTSWRGATVGVPSGQMSLSIEQFEPDCWHTCEWSVWAYRESDGAESPRSNIVIVDIPPPRGLGVTVTFRYFRAEDAPGRGPIRGQFYANYEVLSFDAADSSWCGFHDTECGYYLPRIDEAGHIGGVNVDELFAEILRLHTDCPDCSYDFPSTNHAAVSLSEGDDLTLGFNLWEYHSEGADTLLCSESCTLDYENLRDSANSDIYEACPSYDLFAPCRVSYVIRVGTLPGGG